MSENLILSYDKEADVLEVRLEKPCLSYGEEVGDGLFLIRSMEDDHVIGLTIVDFSMKQSGDGLILPIPCQINPKAMKQMSQATA